MPSSLVAPRSAGEIMRRARGLWATGTSLDAYGDDGHGDHDRDQVEQLVTVLDAGFEDQQPVDDRREPLRPEPGRGDPLPPGEGTVDQRHAEGVGTDRDERENREQVAAGGDLGQERFAGGCASSRWSASRAHRSATSFSGGHG